MATKQTYTEYKPRREELYLEYKSAAHASLEAKVKALGDDALLTEFEAAAYLGKSVQWLRNRRIKGSRDTYPQAIKIGGGVRYRYGTLRQAA